MAQEVIKAIFKCFNDNQNFVLEAGAGAGKTHALMEAIEYLQHDFYKVAAIQPNILCITYTNVAKDEINSRILTHKNICVNTMHEFLWDFMNQFQNELIKFVLELIEADKFQLSSEIDKAQKLIDKPRSNTNIEDKKAIIIKNTERLKKYENICVTKISYESYRALYKGVISHDDILTLAIKCLENSVFANIFVNSFTHILIDEFQDTDANILSKLLDVIKSKKEKDDSYLVIGLFGDEMQRIYSNSPLKIDYNLYKFLSIPKLENYRTCEKIIIANNSLRGDGLKQNHKNPDVKFNRLQFVYNLNSDIYLKNYDEIDISEYKRLFLSHRQIAAEIGFDSISSIFSVEYGRYSNDKLLKMEDSFISAILSNVVNILYAYQSKSFELIIQKIGLNSFKKLQFEILCSNIDELLKCNAALERVINVLDESHIQINRKKIEDIISNYKERDKEQFINDLLCIEIDQYINLFKQINGKTQMQTLHGVKGTEFSHVIINMFANQPWTTYNFDNLFLHGLDGSAAVYNAHKLFYVACTRAKSSLIINYITDNEDKNLCDNMLENIKNVFGGLIETRCYLPLSNR